MGPKDIFQEEGVGDEQVLRELEEAMGADHYFSSGRVLSPMMSTPHPLVPRAYEMFVESNLGNPGLYPGTQELEAKVLDWLNRLLHGPAKAAGQITSGGTESNISALWMAKKRNAGKRVLFSRNAHFSLPKACDLLSLEPVEIGLDEKLLPDMDAFEREVARGDVAAVVAIACTTEFGLLEPVKAMGDVLGSEDVDLHVDAAFGGFVLPFMPPSKHYSTPAPFDFRVEQTTSISVDPHKMGGAAIPSGALLLRSPEPAEGISFSSPYLTTDVHSSLLGTRFSAGVAGTYAAIRSMGLEGCRKRVETCLETTRYLVRRCGEIGVEPVVEPYVNIAVFRVEEPKRVKERLMEMGWFVSTTRDPEGLRLVVMPHVTPHVIDNFIEALETVLKNV
ncbi:MAG: tyrosine decarboxylase MfnA [Candidatus Thermoplasmatota archaeon]|nr:tyrosine decarboxylase MfnA [Candidatus Thermoplasmatota archaeon]